MIEQRELVCINCPMGCRLSVSMENGQVSAVSGNTCPRGETYAKDECAAPKRVVTTLVRVAGTHLPLPVKTAAPVPKDLIFRCVEQAATVVVQPPVRIGDVVVHNVCDSGVDMVATAEVQ